MIPNFEEITKDLNKSQRDLIPKLIEIIKQHDKANRIKTPELCEKLGVKPVVLRKLVNAVRTEAIYPIIGSERGYYHSYDLHEINKQIISLNKRASQISRAMGGLADLVGKILVGDPH